MGIDRENDLRVEAMGVAAVEGLAIAEGLCVARPVWDADGIDLLLYRAQATGKVKAVGVQVKAYSGWSFRVYSKYADKTVMAYYVNATSAEDEPPTLYVMTAADASAVGQAYTAAHRRSAATTYGPGGYAEYYWSTIPKALEADLQPYRIGPGSKRTLRKVCRI